MFISRAVLIHSSLKGVKTADVYNVVNGLGFRAAPAGHRVFDVLFVHQAAALAMLGPDLVDDRPLVAWKVETR